MKKYQLFGVRIDDLDERELEQQLIRWMNESVPRTIVTPNPEFILRTMRHESFRLLLNKSDLSLPDGVGLRFAIAATTEDTLLHRHTGVDLVNTLAKLSAQTQHRVMLFGGLPHAAEKTKNHLKKLYPSLEIESIDPGVIEYIDGHFSIVSALRDQIGVFQPHVFIVALGQGKQEEFIDEIRPSISSLRIAVGVGGSFDTLGGLIPRAPIWMRRMGLEWGWRVFIEPKRINRILNASFVFPLIVVYATVKQHNFFHACKKVLPEIYHQLKGL
ncbi:MAG: WecB/TagA/CpsF family glycosyltransferase [Patescibacteria group bacterium]